MSPLAGKVALVTGGNRGLGRGMAEGLARAGSRVVVSSRTEDELEAAARSMGAVAVPADLADAEAARRLVGRVVEEEGRLDVLVHAAGNQVRRPALELGLEDWDRVVGLHLRSAFVLCQEAGRHMVERREGGSIVLVGSLTSRRVGVPGTVAYAAAKSGLLGIMRTLAVEWARHGIRVNLVAPGFFETALTVGVQDDPERIALQERIPMGRLGEPDDLAGTAVYLASEASAYVTGSVITVDGGWSVA